MNNYGNISSGTIGQNFGVFVQLTMSLREGKDTTAIEIGRENNMDLDKEHVGQFCTGDRTESDLLTLAKAWRSEESRKLREEVTGLCQQQEQMLRQQRQLLRYLHQLTGEEESV